MNNPTVLLETAGISKFNIDWDKHIVYLDSIQRLAEGIGKNWSSLATEVEWMGWKWRNLVD